MRHTLQFEVRGDVEQPFVSQVEAARAALAKFGAAFKRTMGVSTRDPGIVGRRRPTTYHGPKRRYDGHDQARIDAAILKRQRRQAARLLRSHP